MRPEILEAALALGAPKPAARQLSWEQFVGHHRVASFAYSARPNFQVLDAPGVTLGADGLRLASVHIDRAGSSWVHDNGVALMDGKQAVSIGAHGLVFTETELRGHGYAGDVLTILYLCHPELYLSRQAAIYPAEGLEVVKRAFENLVKLGVLVKPE